MDNVDNDMQKVQSNGLSCWTAKDLRINVICGIGGPIQFYLLDSKGYQ